MPLVAGGREEFKRLARALVNTLCRSVPIVSRALSTMAPYGYKEHAIDRICIGKSTALHGAARDKRGTNLRISGAGNGTGDDQDDPDDNGYGGRLGWLRGW